MKVLEIAIGLILIYFLYSLLSSIIAEMISSWIGMRARMLRQGIENIMNDIITGTRRDFVRWIKDIFLIEDNKFKYTTAGKFYEEPNIKYLAKPGEHKWYSLRNRKPAYVSAENFVVTILNMFSNKGRGISEWDKIKFAIETNALHLDPETLKMFQDMVKRADDNFKNFVGLLQNHFADTMERVNGWYKRKIGTIIFFIGLFICIVLNVDTFQIVKTLTNDDDKRLKMVELADKVILQKSTVDSLMSIKDSINDLKYKLEAHGIVKENVMKANDILALGWDFKIEKINKNICISKNSFCFQCLFSTIKDTVIIRKLILESKNLRKESGWLQYIIDKKFPQSPDFLKSDTIKKLYKQIQPNINDITDNKILLDTLNKKLKKLNAKEIASIVENQRTILETEKIKQDSIALISGVQLVQFDDIKRISATKSNIIGQGYPSFGSKVLIITRAMAPWKSKFWGILITALALTLGSQFWFDLLKKLVALRSAGVKPEENEEKKKQLEKLKLTGDTITSKDPVEIAISENRGYWESLPGFIAYNKIINNGKVEILLSFTELTNVVSPIEVEAEINGIKKIFEVIISTEKTVKGTFHNEDIDIFPGMIKQNKTEVKGTIAGIVKNLRSGKISLLTCGHVARTDYSNFIDRRYIDVSFFNSNKKLEKIGEVSNVNMSNYVDGALIDITDIKKTEGFYTPIKPYRNLVDSDENKLEVKIHTLRGIKKGKIIRIDKNHAFDDRGAGDVKFFDLIQITGIDSNTVRLTEKGDSGALITDEADNPIGILVGATIKEDEHYSYGIKMKDLLEILQAKII